MFENPHIDAFIIFSDHQLLKRYSFPSRTMSEENYEDDNLMSLEQIDRESPEMWTQSKRTKSTLHDSN